MRGNHAAAVAGAALFVFGARRALLAAAALAPARPLPPHGSTPRVAFVVPARNEEASLARLLAALDALDYPGLTVVAVDDGSTDGPHRMLAAWGAGRPLAIHVTLPLLGKAAALNAGLSAAPSSEVVVVCDAD